MSMLSGLALAIAVTKAGKHVVAEKPWPCGRTLTMIEACDAAGVKLIVKQNWFNVPVVNEALDARRFGRLVLGTAPFVGAGIGHSATKMLGAVLGRMTAACLQIRPATTSIGSNGFGDVVSCAAPS